jgi:oxygen-independent coproporphyrinogen-3 oxidase
VLSLPPLGVYVHLPWCERKCPYCDFNSHEPSGEPPFEAYVERLLEDLDEDLPWACGRTASTVFLGGGTPSLCPPALIGRLLEGLAARLGLAADVEVTLEANPGSSDAGHFAGYRAAGVTRLSIGVQSFDDASLRALGRIHDADTARRAVRAAKRAGFGQINLDLMHGLPGQDAAGAARDLAAAIVEDVPHLSWYQLTIEQNTVFHRRPPVLPAEDDLAEAQAAGEALLDEGGYTQYEVSAFAREGNACRHNLNYWRFGDYLGLGAGAHGKLTLPEQGGVIRTRRTRSPRDYLRSPAAARRVTEDVATADLPLEYLMNALRLREGGTVAAFEAHTGLSASLLSPARELLVAEGLLESDPRRLCTTPTGFRFLDSVLARFA